MMGRFMTLSRADLRPVKKQQVFTVSGVFVPSAALLDAGGVVTVRCVGGGGGGGWNSGIGGGGSSGVDITRIVTVSGPVDVLIGAGGAGASGWNTEDHATAGGATAFGDMLIAPGGHPGLRTRGGRVAGDGSRPGGHAQYHFVGNTNSNSTTSARIAFASGAGGGYGGHGLITLEDYSESIAAISQTRNAPPNTGGGGAGNWAKHTGPEPSRHGGNGGSGLCIVSWEE